MYERVEQVVVEVGQKRSQCPCRTSLDRGAHQVRTDGKRRLFPDCGQQFHNLGVDRAAGNLFRAWRSRLVPIEACYRDKKGR